MEVSTAGLMEIAAHEGIVPYPYRDSVGVWTWGIGHTAAAGPPDPSKMAKGVASPLEVVLHTFRQDIARYAADVRKAVKVPLHQHEFDALVSFHFNTGAIRKASITRLLNAGDKAGAAKVFDRWRKPPEIIGRRNAERDLFWHGAYVHKGWATVYPADVAGKVQWSKGKRVDLAKVLSGPPMSDPPFMPPPERKPAAPIVVLPAGAAGPLPDNPGPTTTAPWAETPPAGHPWRAAAGIAIVVIGALAVAVGRWLGG